MTFEDATIKGQHLDFSYADLEIQSPEHVNLAVGDRSVNFFLNPNDFPITVAGERINLCMLYGDNNEEMTVQRVDADGGASMDVYSMDDYQKTITFLYLLGKVLNDGG